MSRIKNFDLLIDVSEKEKLMMEHAALEHARYSNISFKFTEYKPPKVIIQIVQGKSPTGIHHSKERLIEIVHETFDQFFTGKDILVHTVPYIEPPVNVVDAAWINARMLETGTKLKDIAADTGLGYSNVSTLINGGKEVSQTMKAMFYYYFKSKNAVV